MSIAFQNLANTPPYPEVKDVQDRKVSEGDAIVYGAGRGGIELGVVAEVKYKWVDRGTYDRSTNSWVPGWKTTLKVRVAKSSWGGGKEHVTLQSLNNLLLLDGEGAKLCRDDIEQSWLDPDKTL